MSVSNRARLDREQHDCKDNQKEKGGRMIIIVFFISFMVMFLFMRAITRANFDRKTRQRARRETSQETEKTYESDFDEGFLAEAGIHPHSWIGRPR